MTFQQTIEYYQNGIVQIAAKAGTGTGFYLSQYNLIVTNNHVVKNEAYVTIKGRNFKRQVSQVVFADSRYDIAFLLPPTNTSLFPELFLGNSKNLSNGDRVLAIGHPYGLSYSATEGVVSRASRIYNGLEYIQVDAAINPGNSGGPLVSDGGEIVGVNTFIIRGGDNLGFALPSNYLRDALVQYLPMNGKVTIRCPSCRTVVTADMLDQNRYCPTCGQEIKFPELTKPIEETAGGIAHTISEILTALGHDAQVANTGTNHWLVDQGTARIKISYDPTTFYILSDALLCRLPRQRIAELYSFLLRENNTLQGMYFSILGENIVLSSVVHNLDLNIVNGTTLFQSLFDNADRYDEILMKDYGCEPILLDE